MRDETDTSQTVEPASDRLGVRARSARRRRAAGVAISAAAHLALLGVILGIRAEPRMTIPPESDAFPVSVVDYPGPPEPPGPPAPEPAPPGPPEQEPPAADRAAPVKAIARPTPIPPKVKVETIAAAEIPAPPLPLLTDSQIAGAMTADAGSGGGGGGGGGGGECNMLRRLQASLRDDHLVRTAVSEAHRSSGSARPILVWNGAWIRSPGQDGAGLAALRQAIMWEVAFAPEACRREQMRGLALIALDSAGSRIAVGSGDWRWGDLLRR